MYVEELSGPGLCLLLWPVLVCRIIRDEEQRGLLAVNQRRQLVSFSHEAALSWAVSES